MDIGAFPQLARWDWSDWEELFKISELKPGDIATVEQMHCHSPSGYAEKDFVAIVTLERTDGRLWASVHAGCDTTGWGCHGDYVRWYLGTDRDDVIINGLTNESRRVLGIELPDYDES